MPETDPASIKAIDSVPVELVITPRKQIPKKDSIYTSLMERLEKKDSLLDFGEVRVQAHGDSIPSSVSDSRLYTRRKLHVERLTPRKLGVKGTVQLQRLGSLRSTQQNEEDDETKNDGVEELLEKLQEANYVASGKRGFGNQNHFVFAK